MTLNMLDLPTPALVLDAAKVHRNLRRMADFVRGHNLKLRPHTKTHKSVKVARMQLGEGGAWGLTVAKVGEAAVMAEAADDLLMAYPAVDPRRCTVLAELAKRKTVRVGLDSATAAEALSAAASSAGSTIGILVDLDVGMHRTGVQSPHLAGALAMQVDKLPGLRLDGLMFYPGHIGSRVEQQGEPLAQVDALLGETSRLWAKHGLRMEIMSGGSTPTGYQSHLIKHVTEIRPGTYVYNDMNTVYGGFCSLDDCAARIVCTVVSDAVPGQIVIDAGTKTLTSDRNGPAPESGHGYIVEYPDAKIVKLTEEHGQVAMSKSDRKPKVGEQVTVIPNHICPCVNLQDKVWWQEAGEQPTPMTVDARGRVF
jgi:D-serine deaminase-like pyridoxal phosphate-dependent protein